MKDKKYWLEEVDRFGLIFCGIFLGGMIEAIGIPRLSIIISVAALIVLVVIDFLIKKSKHKEVKDG